MHLLREGWTLSSLVSHKRARRTADLRLLSGGISLNKTLANTLLPVRLQWAARSQECKALVDFCLGTQRTITAFCYAVHHPYYPHHVWQSHRKDNFFSHRLSLSTCRVGPSVAHQTQSQDRLGPELRVCLDRVMLCALSCVCLFPCVLFSIAG